MRKANCTVLVMFVRYKKFRFCRLESHLSSLAKESRTYLNDKIIEKDRFKAEQGRGLGGGGGGWKK